MQLDFERTKVSMNLYGKKYDLTMPTMSELFEFEARRKEAILDPESLEINAVIKDFLKERGIPNDIYDKIESVHVTSIVNALTTGKKN